MKMTYPMVRERGGNLISYTLLGGYPVLYVDRNGDVVCPDCANLFESDPEWRHEWEDNRPWIQFVHYEGPAEHCSHCNAEVESAYGDPNNPED